MAKKPTYEIVTKFMFESDERGLEAKEPETDSVSAGRPLSNRFYSIAASVSIVAGVLSLAIGVICVVINAAVGGESVFGGVATILLILGIPLLLIASAFMDAVDDK